MGNNLYDTGCPILHLQLVGYLVYLYVVRVLRKGQNLIQYLYWIDVVDVYGAVYWTKVYKSGEQNTDENVGFGIEVLEESSFLVYALLVYDKGKN